MWHEHNQFQASALMIVMVYLLSSSDWYIFTVYHTEADTSDHTFHDCQNTKHPPPTMTPVTPIHPYNVCTGVPISYAHSRFRTTNVVWNV